MSTAAVQTPQELLRHGRLTHAPWWSWPVLVFVVTRVADAIMILRAATHQIALYPQISTYQIVEASPASPGYLGVAVNWDAQWFWQIALHGYPHELPWREGMIWRSEWAFAPLYPLTSRAMMHVTGLSFAAAGTILTIAFSCAAVVLVFKLVDETAGRFPAQATTLLLCTSMAAPVFQIAYTEGPALFFVALALLFLRRQRYVPTALALLGLGLTRHVLAPFVVVLAVHALLRWRAGGRPDRPSLLLLVTGVAMTALWPVTAAVATGRLTAFTDTQRGWRRSKSTGPFGLFSVAAELGGPSAVAGVAMALAAVLWLVLRRGGPRWGPEVRTWAAAYPTYIALVAPAGISVFRLMLLAFPLMWVLPEYRPTPRTQVVTVVVLAVVGMYLQWYWIRHFLVIGPIAEQFAMP